MVSLNLITLHFLGKSNGPREDPLVSLRAVVVFVFLFFLLLLFTLDSQNVTGEGDINVFRLHPRNLGLHCDIVLGFGDLQGR